jgi:hypothetical protein
LHGSVDGRAPARARKSVACTRQSQETRRIMRTAPCPLAVSCQRGWPADGTCNLTSWRSTSVSNCARVMCNWSGECCTSNSVATSWGAQHGLFHQGTQEAVRRRLAPQPVRPGQNGLRGLDRCVSNGPPRAQPRAGYRLCPACACCVEQCWQITSHPEGSCQVLARAFNKRNSLSAMYRSACAAILHS